MSKRQNIFLFFIIVSFCFLSFSTTLNIGFIWDDHQMIVENPYIKSFNSYNFMHNIFSNAFNQEGANYYRPLQLFSYMLDFKFFKLNPSFWHLVNLSFHCLNSVLLFLLLKRINFSLKLSLLASLLFAVNPIVVEQMIIIAGRAELMSFTFTLLSILLYLKGDMLSFILSLLSFVLSMFSKESGVITPFIIILILNFLKKDYSKKMLFYFLLIPFYLSLRKAAVSGEILDIGYIQFFKTLFLKAPYMIFNYFYKTILPFNLHSHNVYPDFNIYSYLVLSALFLYAIYKLFAYNRELALFSFLWYFLFLIPKLPLLSSQDLILDHWIYPSNAALYILLAVLILKIEDIKKRYIFSTAILSSWIFFSNYNISLRDNDIKLYENAIKYRTSSKVYYNLSREYYILGDFKKARELLENVFEKNKDDEMFLNAYSLILMKTGDRDKARDLLLKLFSKGPNMAMSYLNLSSLYIEDKKYDKALDILFAGLAKFPDNENIELYLARVFGLKKEKTMAYMILKDIVYFNPYNIEALLNLGLIEFENRNYSSSKSYFEKVLEIDRENQLALEYLNRIKSR